MKRILLSIMTIAIVVAAGVYSTQAYFNDTEKSVGNEIQAGTIDISVDEQNPWTKTYTQQTDPDLKPGEAKTITFTVKNEGTNPLVLRKSLGNYIFSTGLQSEPECVAENGTWNNSTKICSGMSAEDNDLSKVMIYSMTVQKNGGAVVTVIPESAGTTMANVKDLWFPMGELAAGDTLKVTQTYKLDPTADNKYQGDKITFDITLFAEQRLGPGLNTVNGVMLDNKSGTPDWYSIVDGTWAIVQRSGTTATVKAYGLTPGGLYDFQYSLTPYAIGTSMASGIALGDGTLTLVGTLPAAPQTDMKLWLRDVPGTETGTLWEVNLLSY